ncbi:MAG: glycosyltransferase family 9 protein [Bacteroidota bacterium]
MGLYSFIYKTQFELRQKIAGKIVGFREKITKSKAPSFLTPIFSDENKGPKIIFILTGLIGDCIMCTPVITQAKKIWPAANMTVLGRKGNIQLFQVNPFVDHFYETPFMPYSIRNLAKKKKLAKWLRAEAFDIAIILTGDHFAKMLYDARIPIRVGSKGHLLQSCLTHVYDTISPEKWNHETRLNSLRCLGYPVENILPQLWVDNVTIKSMFEKLKIKGLLYNKYIVLHPFGSTRRQWWNPDAVPDLVKSLSEHFNCQVVLIGGPETSGVFPSMDNLVDTTGSFSISELKAVIKEACFVITTDSGPFHIAGAFHKKIIGLFRAVRPELATIYPEASVILGRNELCQATCNAYHCRQLNCAEMHEISVEAILTKADQLQGIAND